MRDEGGFTLTEVVVTLGIMSIAMVIALTFLTHVTNLSNRAINDVQTENDARLALRAITEDIRAAKPNTITFTGPTSTCPATPTAGTCINFIIVRDTAANPGCESAITYGLLGTSVRETRQDYGCTSDHRVSGKSVISHLVNGSSPLFTYFDKQGNSITTGQASAGSVGVTLLLQYQARSPILTMTSYASLRNAR
jgi:prepilin-type N-terminal cleavage/methylation domain-containing protein